MKAWEEQGLPTDSRQRGAGADPSSGHPILVIGISASRSPLPPRQGSGDSSKFGSSTGQSDADGGGTAGADADDLTDKWPKSNALYIHRDGADYTCSQCMLWIADTNQCVIHHPTIQITGDMGCGFWVMGTPMKGVKPQGDLDPWESGLAKSPFGCKNCEYFDPSGDCSKVDKESEGDDPGEINPGACCTRMEPKDDAGAAPEDDATSQPEPQMSQSNQQTSQYPIGGQARAIPPR